MTPAHRIRLNSVALAMACGIAASAAAGERVTIASEGPLVNWRPAALGAQRAEPGYPGVVADKSKQVCVGIGYQINKDGTTSDFTLLKTWSAGDPKDSAQFTPFAQNAIAAVQGWRFVAAEGFAPKTVYTAATFAFSAGADRSALRDKCVIGDLPGFIAKAQSETFKRGNIKKNLMEQRRQQENAYESVRIP